MNDILWLRGGMYCIDLAVAVLSTSGTLCESMGLCGVIAMDWASHIYDLAFYVH